MEKKNFTENGNKFIVSEFVSYGHPDKIADQIADAILDAYLEKDLNARTGIEVMVKDNIVVLGGEVNSTATVDYDRIVRKVYEKLDFPSNHHLSPNDIKVINLIGKQSEEIHNGVDREDEIGAGDQGFMVGYASNETSVYMPLGYYMAKTICNSVANMNLLGPDTKTQVIVEYDVFNNPIRIFNILVSTMHQCSLDCVKEKVKAAIENNLVFLNENIYEKFIKDKDIKIDVNPCGSWHIGGPVSDCGVTGRKLVVDSYGGYCNIGGGNYSGKDLSKVDRSAAYAARWLAKNIVASGICNKAKVTLSYMIGVAQPCSVEIDTDTNKDKVIYIKQWLAEHLDLTPGAFIKAFYGDNVGQFYTASRKGHFGYDADSNVELAMTYPWERLDLVDDLKQFL